MIIGVLQIELLIEGSQSLKDKRSVVASLKDRLHREHQVSVAEVDSQDNHRAAVLGITMAATSVPHCQRTLDRLINKLKRGRGFVLQDHNVQILAGQ